MGHGQKPSHRDQIFEWPCHCAGEQVGIQPRVNEWLVDIVKKIEGGGEETRSNKWLAELQQDMFVEINPADAQARGIKDGAWVWVTGAENGSKAKVKALVTERVGKGVAWMPFHFGGWFGGADLRGNYPAGADPVVLGESANTITTYGYDPATGMQEPKVTLCQIAAA